MPPARPLGAPRDGDARLAPFAAVRASDGILSPHDTNAASLAQDPVRGRLRRPAARATTCRWQQRQPDLPRERLQAHGHARDRDHARSLRSRQDRRGRQINERFDVYVIPLANAFRATFAEQLAPLTSVIEKLKIPVVVLSAGLPVPLPTRPARRARSTTACKAFAGPSSIDRRRSAFAARSPRTTSSSSGSTTSRSSAAPRCSSTATSCPSPSRRRPSSRDARIGVNITRPGHRRWDRS